MSVSSRAAWRALLFGASLFAPVSAFANDEGALVDSVIVTARRDPEDPPVVAQARELLSRTPGSVAVVAAESYETRYAQGLTEVLRDVPGVFAQRKWGDDMRLSIRGSGVGNANHNRGTLLAQDGIPFNEADGFGDYQLIDPLIARYTEVYKGGNALRFGGALLGGAINLVTPTGGTAGEDNLLRLDAGAFGLVRGHGALARSFGDLDVYAAATGLSADGWREQSRQRAARLSLNVGRSFGEERDLRLILSAHDIDQQIPGSVTLADALADPRRANAGNLANNYQRNMRAVRSSLQSHWRLTPSTTLEGGVYASWKHVDHPIFQVLDQESVNTGAFTRLDWRGEVGGRKADLFYGAFYRHGDMDALQFVNLRGDKGAKRADSDQKARALDLFAEGRLFVTDRLAAIVGGSYGWTERRYRSYVVEDAPTSFALARTVDYDWFAPRVGLLWQADDGAQLYANLTRSIEAPNFSSLAPTAGGFTPLAPQEAWTAEAGARGRRGPLTWDVAVYRAEMEKELLNYTVDADHPAATFNAQDTIHQGLEAALDWRLARRWRLRQTYTWSDFRFDGDAQYGDNRLPIVPEHYYRAALEYSAKAGWFVTPSVEWAISAPYVDYANTLKAPAFAIASLNAGWRFDNGVSLFVDARNLFDKRYVSNVNAITDARLPAVSKLVAFPGEGRSAYAGLRVSF